MNRVCKLSAIQWSEPKGWRQSAATIGLRRVRVNNIAGDEKA